MNNEEKSLTQQYRRPIRAPYKQVYRSAWANVAEFKDWIAPVAGNPYKAYCKYCERELHTHRLSLLKHCSSLKHEVRLKEFQQSVGQEIVPLDSKEASHTIPSSTSDKPIYNFSMKYTSCPSTSKSVSKKVLPVNEETLPSKRRRTQSLDTSNNSGTNELMSKSQEENVHVEEDNWVNNENEDLTEEHYHKEPFDNADREEDDYCTSFSETDTPIPTPVPSLVEKRIERAAITTHILDTSRGKPAIGIKVSLYKLVDSIWTNISESVTNNDGRCSDLLSRETFHVGRYKLHFDVGNYFKELQIASLYPFIEIVFDCSNDEDS